MVKSKLLYLFMFFMAQFGNIQAVEFKTDADALRAMGIEIADMRNMLTTYVMNATGMIYKAPEERLKKSIKFSEDTIVALKEKYKDPAIASAINKGQKSWVPFKNALGTSLDKNVDTATKKDGALSVHNNTRAVIIQLEEIRKQIAKKIDIKDANLYNAALTIAATSRGFAAHYMLKMWKVPDPTIQKHWERLTKNHKAAIKVIRDSDKGKDPKVKKILDKFDRNYAYIDNLYSKMVDKYMPSIMDRKTSDSYKRAMQLADTILNNK